jgi:hypothetical protein
MIPKSLVIAVATGVTASAILGIYLQNLNPPGVVFVQGPSVSVHTEKQDYGLGEKIPIQIINSGTSEITFSNLGLQIRALDGTVFFSTTFDGLRLEPKQQHVFEWDQQKNDNTKIIEGRYIVDLIAYDQNNQKLSDNITLNVLK